MNDRHDKLMRQVAAYCDGRLDTASLAAFEARLSEDTQAVDVLIDYMDLHAQLRWVESALHAQVDHPPASRTHATARPTNRWRLGVSMFALAAAVLIAATAWFLFLPEPRTPNPEPSPTPPPSVATLTDSRGATFADTPGPMNLGASLPPGPIKLTAGKAQIMFASTATVDLQGPCEFEMTGPNRGRLTSGSLKASVPEAAQGFTIDLPDGSRVVDLGTKFGIKIDSPTGPLVEVFAGSVRLEMVDGQTHNLLAGHAARMADSRVVSIERTNLLTNGDFEQAGPEGSTWPADWTLSKGRWWRTNGRRLSRIDPKTARQGEHFLTASHHAVSHVDATPRRALASQVVELTDEHLAFAQQAGARVVLHFFYNNADPQDEAGVSLDLLDSSGSLLQSQALDPLEPTDEAAWSPGKLSVPFDPATRSIRVRLQGRRNKLTDTNVSFDSVRLTLSIPHDAVDRAAHQPDQSSSPQRDKQVTPIPLTGGIP